MIHCHSEYLEQRTLPLVAKFEAEVQGKVKDMSVNRSYLGPRYCLFPESKHIKKLTSLIYKSRCATIRTTDQNWIPQSLIDTAPKTDSLSLEDGQRESSTCKC